MTRDRKMEWAGEYAIGLLDAAEKAAFEAQMARDPELAALVKTFADKLHSLDETAAAVATPAMWNSIEQRVATTVQQPARAANDNKSSTVNRWGAAAAAVVLALGVGYFAGQRLQPSPASPTVIAVLLDQSDQSPGAIIEAFGDDTVHVVPLERFAVPDGSVLQVWTLPDPQTGPVSLGTIGSAAEAHLIGPRLPAPASGQLYEITLEPAPGSPTGRPTGPILVKGYAKAPI